MGVTLAEPCLLGKNTQHSQVGYIGHRCGRFSIASLESLNYKYTNVLAQQRGGRKRQSQPWGTSERAAPPEAKATHKMKEYASKEDWLHLVALAHVVPKNRKNSIYMNNFVTLAHMIKILI